VALNSLGTCIKVVSIFTWFFDADFSRNHAQRIFGQRQVETTLEGLEAGVDALVWCIAGALLDLVQLPISNTRRGWEELGGWTGSTVGFCYGVVVACGSCILKTCMGVLDLSVKIFEGIRIFFSPREHMTTRMEYPLVVHTDGRVREYDEGEARAYFLLSACSRLSDEYYQAHYHIDVVERREPTREYGAAGMYRRWHSRDRREHVLLITTKRIIFGTTKPLKVIFEVQVERIARVELPPPHTSLILWSWHKLPVCSSPFDYFRSNARPNTIQEREIYSSNPRQLKAAFIHLSSLAHRRMTELAATPDVNMLHENDAPLPDVFSTMEVTSSDYRTPAIVEIEQDDERVAVGVDRARGFVVLIVTVIVVIIIVASSANRKSG